MPPIRFTASSKTQRGVYLSSLLDAARCGIELQDDELNLFTVGFGVGEMLSDGHQKGQGGSGKQHQRHGQSRSNGKNLFLKTNGYEHTRKQQKNQ